MSDTPEAPNPSILAAIKTLYTTVCVMLFIAGLMAPTIWQTSRAFSQQSSVARTDNAHTTSDQARDEPSLVSSLTRNPAPTTVEKPIRIPPPPAYKLTPVEPVPANGHDYSMVMQECHRQSENIICVASVQNNTDAPTQVNFHYATAIDDEGNTLSADLGGGYARLLPGIPVKVQFHIEEIHESAKYVSLELRLTWERNQPTGNITFTNIPIQ